jgi:multidrug resistance efflux pump
MFFERASGAQERVVLALALLAATACDSAVKAVAPAESYSVTATGRLDAASEARYLVGQRDGVIRAVTVRTGQSVRKGDTLIELSCEDVRARLESAQGQQATAISQVELLERGPLPSEIAHQEAEVEAASARSSNAVDLLRREEALKREGYAAERTLVQMKDEAKARQSEVASAQAVLRRVREGARQEERAAARGALATANAHVKEALAEVQKCIIEAPIDGTILRIFRREGEFSGASQGTPLIAIANLNSMIVRAEIDERDAPDVSVRVPADVWIEGRPERWTGRVVEVSSLMGRRTARSLDPADHFDRETLEVIVAMDNPSVPRQVGLRVTVGLRGTGQTSVGKPLETTE